MAATRTNRFRRPGRSFRPPVDGDGGSDANMFELEQGPFLSERDYSWTRESEDEPRASSNLETKKRSRKHPFRHFGYHARIRASLADRSNPAVSPEPMATTRHKSQQLRSRTCLRLMSVLKMALMTLGLLQCVMYLCGVLEALFPDEFDLVSGPLRDSFISSNPPNPGSMYYLSELTADVQPFMCHSHNDYWRREPLYQAIHAGCTGVEADVWLLNDDLYVAHSPSGIRRNRTLETLYLDPLLDLFDEKNFGPGSSSADAVDNVQRVGLFDTRPKQSLVLLIDLKNKPDEIWDQVDALLGVFRDRRYLTYANGSDVVSGPLTVVVSGDAPFSRVVENSTYRDIFYDAPLDALDHLPPITLPPKVNSDSPDTHSDLVPTSPALSDDQETSYSPFNSYYASTSFKRSIGYPFHSSLTQIQLQKIRRQIRTAHALGLKVRYWGIPAWPIGVRNYIWRVLVREGVDYLSVDDIEDVRRKDWGPKKGGWGKKWWR